MENETVTVYLPKEEMLKAYGFIIIDHNNGVTAPYFSVFYNGICLKAYQEYRCTVSELKAAVELAYLDHLVGSRNTYMELVKQSKRELNKLESEIRKFRGGRKELSNNQG